ncbi:hypothetical protein G3T14_11900 [Methylobacterium sp. BTF04]|uniref:hypothetical protein n=1 Tax=Methylobacterium sp. BTF04 TaxID=2708300 RepID=UPI0013D7DACE|nr:hypothetical protein [Methylobacterium sp. BTF04]NEU12835.1 hypothetical protein [Methylobacterium sp. BTF04]
MHRIPATALSARLLAAAVLSAGLFVFLPSAPARAQSLTAPAGQARVTAPGGLRGRAAMRHHRQRHRMMHHRRHR